MSEMSKIIRVVAVELNNLNDFRYRMLFQLDINIEYKSKECFFFS